MQQQAPISEADSNELAARNCEGTEQLRVTFDSQLGIIPAGLFFYQKGDKQHEKRTDYYDKQ